MKNNKNAVMVALAMLSLPVSAQVKIDSIKPDRFAAQSIDVGADINFSRQQSTAAVSVITSESTNKRSAKNIGNSILGQGNGLISLQGSGNYAGINPTFYVRGLQTLNGNNSPLFLVDGIERDIKYISAEEVESVSILKDAAATALYGYKGANGVVLITTKRGKVQPREIKINIDHAINFMNHKPKFVDAQTYAKAMNEAYANDGYENPRYTQEEVEAFGNGSYPYLYPNVDWVNETFRDHSVTNMLNATFTGGSERFKYYTNLDLQYDNGFVKNANMNDGYSTNNKYVKGNLRMNMDMKLTRYATMKVNLLGVLEESNAPGASANLWDLVYTLPSAAFAIKGEDGKWGGNATWDGTKNPVAQSQDAGYCRNHNRGIMADLTLRDDLSSILPGLGAQARIAYDHFSNIYENYSKTYVYGSPTVSEWVDGEPVLGKPYSSGKKTDLGTAASTNSFTRHLHIDASVDYQNRFGNHSIYSQLKYDYEFSDKYAINSTIYRQDISWYSHYGFLDRYFLDLALVESGSNKMAPGSKWALSPTVSAAWVLSKESWLKNINWINFLKLRASYGVINTDNQPDGNWTYYMQTYVTNGTTYPWDNSYQGMGNTYLGRMATTGLTHEKAKKFNAGIDATLFGGLDITLDGYYQRRSNIWVSTAGKYSSELGMDAPYEGDGIVDSWGWELGLDYNKQVGNWKFNLGGNFSYNRNEIKEQDEAPVLYDNLRTTGHRISQLYGYKAIGFFKDEEDIANSKPQLLGSTPRPGDIKYEDVNGDGQIDTNDKTAIGYNTVAPEIYYNLHLGIEWKGLGLDAMFQGTGRYTGVLNTKSMYMPLVGNTTISQYYYDNRWTPETAETAKFPALSSSSNANNYNTNTLWMFDRSFFKLRNIELYYNFPKSLLLKTGFLNAAKLYVRGTDLFSLDHVDKSDPEVYGATNPTTKSVVVGLSVTF